MTVVGKLLVFLNLVFSLVVGTFAVFDYSARTHWSEAYKKVEADNAVLKGTVAAYKSDAEKLSKEKADLNNTFIAQAKDLELKGDGAKIAQTAIARIQDQKKSIDNLSGQLVALQAQLQEEKNKSNNLRATTDAGQLTEKGSREDVVKLRETLRAENDRYSQLVKDMNVLRDKKTAAEIETESLKDRNQAMLTRMTELERDMARLKAQGLAAGALARRPTGPTRTSEATPPPENVEGLVSRADGNLVKISIGSDSGVSKGNTLEVFRLGVTPRYLGRIRIVEVTPTEAVGQALGRMSVPLQAGDRVASSILPR